jgi:hypothetical protein
MSLAISAGHQPERPIDRIITRYFGANLSGLPVSGVHLPDAA